MDGSWWLAFGGIKLLIDPWLEGTEIDYAGWFNTQWHQTPPIPYEDVPESDAIFITQKYPDHFHPETLSQLRPKHLIGPSSIEKKLKRFFPEAKVDSLHANSKPLKLGDVTIHMLPTRRKIDPIYDAFLLDDGHESIVVAPHGLTVDEGHRETIQQASDCTLLISPYNRYQLPKLLGGTVLPGLEGLKALIEDVKPRFVARTHDEPKHGKGLIPRLSKITVCGPQEIAENPWLAERHLELEDYDVTPIDRT